jgi:hypothetical protein
MEFIVHYWCAQWPELTGFEQGDTITEEQVHTLIREAKVNVMVHHSKDGKSHTCFIDDINHRFQQR